MHKLFNNIIIGADFKGVMHDLKEKIYEVKADYLKWKEEQIKLTEAHPAIIDLNKILDGNRKHFYIMKTKLLSHTLKEVEERYKKFNREEFNRYGGNKPKTQKDTEVFKKTK